MKTYEGSLEGWCVIAKRKRKPRLRLSPLPVVIEVILDELPEPEPFKGPRKGLPSDHAKHAPGDRVFLVPRLVSEDDVGLYTDLRRLMPTLTERQREIFSALFEHDMGIEAVSQEFDISPPRVIAIRNDIALKLQSLRSV